VNTGPSNSAVDGQNCLALGADHSASGCRSAPRFSVGKLMEPGGFADQRRLRVEAESPVHGRVVMPGPVMRLSHTPMRPGFLPGPFGCDRDEILAGIAGGTDSSKQPNEQR